MTDWTQAKCLDADPEAFFPTLEMGHVHLDAIRLCMQCPIRVDCLEWALDNLSPFDDHGIWGGTTVNQRKRMREEAA